VGGGLVGGFLGGCGCLFWGGGVGFLLVGATLKIGEEGNRWDTPQGTGKSGVSSFGKTDLLRVDVVKWETFVPAGRNEPEK